MSESLPEFETDQPGEFLDAKFKLPESEIDDLKKLAERRGKTVTEVLRQALVTENLLQTMVDNGGRIFLETAEGVTCEFNFHEDN
jgi:hypothetical protein